MKARYAHHTYIPEHIQLTQAQRYQLPLTVVLQMLTITGCCFVTFALLLEPTYPRLWKIAVMFWVIACSLYLMALGDLLRVNARMTGKIWQVCGAEVCNVLQAQEALAGDDLPEDKDYKQQQSGPGGSIQ